MARFQVVDWQSTGRPGVRVAQIVPSWMTVADEQWLVDLVQPSWRTLRNDFVDLELAGPAVKKVVDFELAWMIGAG